MQRKRTAMERFFGINQQLICSFFEIQPMLYGRYLTLHARLKKNARRSFEESHVILLGPYVSYRIRT